MVDKKYRAAYSGYQPLYRSMGVDGLIGGEKFNTPLEAMEGLSPHEDGYIVRDWSMVERKIPIYGDNVK